MSRWIARLVAPLVLMAVAPQILAQEDKEPPLLTCLEVGGIKIPIELDKPLELKTPEGATSVTLRVEPYRVFPYAGLQFRYPRSYNFEADFESPDVHIWSLAGPNSMVMVCCFPASPDPGKTLEQSLAGSRQQFGSVPSSVEPSSLKLGDEELSGTLLKVAIGGAKIHQQYFALSATGGTIVLVLQDTAVDDDTPSAEFGGLVEMLRDSFQVKR